MGQIVQAFGQVLGGVQAYQNADYQAGVYSQQAQMARKLGDLEAERTRRIGERQGASIVARGVSSGLSLSGSLVDVTRDQLAVAGRAAALAVMNSQWSSELYKAKGRSEKMTGQARLTSGLISGAGTLAPSVGSFF
jgi:uncharacterized membrane protein